MTRVRSPRGLLVSVARRAVLVLAATMAAGLLAQPAAAQDRDVLIFAAASLKNALDEAAAQYKLETGKTVVASYAASSALAKQIEAAAPADMFISADQDWMNYLDERELIRPESRADLLGNRLVLIAPADSKVSAEIGPGFPLAELLGEGRLAMADPQSVPAGKYGRAALESLGVWGSVEARVAPAENVRAALELVARGEAPLGIVYRTDATAQPEVKVIGVFPANSHPPIVYPIALLAGSENAEAAGFLAWLRSDAARPLFEKQGFTVLKSEPTT